MVAIVSENTTFVSSTVLGTTTCRQLLRHYVVALFTNTLLIPEYQTPYCKCLGINNALLQMAPGKVEGNISRSHQRILDGPAAWLGKSTT